MIDFYHYSMEIPPFCVKYCSSKHLSICYELSATAWEFLLFGCFSLIILLLQHHSTGSFVVRIKAWKVQLYYWYDGKHEHCSEWSYDVCNCGLVSNLLEWGLLLYHIISYLNYHILLTWLYRKSSWWSVSISEDFVLLDADSMEIMITWCFNHIIMVHGRKTMRISVIVLLLLSLLYGMNMLPFIWKLFVPWSPICLIRSLYYSYTYRIGWA
jgi:hypothetical protein